MFTAHDASKLNDDKWDQRIRAAVELDLSDTDGHAFLLVRGTSEATEALYQLKARGFRVYDTEEHDHECERLPFSWRNHRE